jgi:hypothetical protein
MLQILHKGIQMSLDLDTTSFTGNAETDSALAYIQALDAGMVAGYDADGYAQLADGAAAGDVTPMGFIINDAAGSFFENKPAIASGKLTITFGNCVIITNKIDTSETFAPKDRLYVGTGAKVGLITKTPPTNARLFGIAMSTASSAAPNLTIAVLG